MNEPTKKIFQMNENLFEMEFKLGLEPTFHYQLTLNDLIICIKKSIQLLNTFSHQYIVLRS